MIRFAKQLQQFWLYASVQYNCRRLVEVILPRSRQSIPFCTNLFVALQRAHPDIVHHADTWRV
jgi:hypothetical protein